MGRVKSLQRYSLQNHLLPEKILAITHSQGGYCDVSLSKDGKRIHKKIHRLVAEAFIPNPDNKPEVDHIDTDKDNNNVNNLRWVTHSENHLNPLTVKLKRVVNRHLWSQEQREKQCKRIQVLKDNQVIYTFNSYYDMDINSKNIFGYTLWNIYVRQVIKGERIDYHGYTFKII